MIDLHIHTTATPHHSGWSPEYLARFAAHNGYQWIAAADHNTTASTAALRSAAQSYGVHTASAVEIDSAACGKLWHTLVYGADPSAPALKELCDEVVARNEADTQRLLILLPRLGLNLGDTSQLPPVINVAVIAARLAALNDLPGRVEGEGDEEAGMRFFLTHLPDAYRPLQVREVIEVAHQLGGLAVLAHPGREKGIYAVPATATDISHLVSTGLDGLEVYYPSHDETVRRFLADQAQHHRLLMSGGSDSHYPDQPLARWRAEQLTIIAALAECW